MGWWVSSSEATGLVPVRGCSVDSQLVNSERITHEQVRHVARLARLELSDEEVQRFAGQLGDILDHAAVLSELPIAEVEPTAHPLPVENVFRSDEVRPSLDRAEVLEAAPLVESERFRVPRILGEST